MDTEIVKEEIQQVFFQALELLETDLESIDDQILQLPQEETKSFIRDKVEHLSGKDREHAKRFLDGRISSFRHRQDWKVRK